MDYEKKYKEALERAREQLEGAKIFDYKEEQIAYDIRTTTYAIFPELKESEGDRVRREMTDFLISFNNGCYTKPEEAKIDVWIAWLEKQGEQDKPLVTITQKDFASKVEPKFRNGQWIVWQDKCYKVNYNGCGYELVDQNGFSTSLEYGTIDENAHLWTIKDALDGDVLYSPEHKLLWIYKNQEEYHACNNCNYANFTSFGADIVIPSDVCPATKEQCDFLFKKIHDAGYEWNPDKKELKKIEHKPTEDIDAASIEYRNFRMSCGITDPVMLDEIEEAFYSGACAYYSGATRQNPGKGKE